MSRRWRAAVDDAGETLVELIVSITIFSIIVIAIGSGITLSVIVSDQHRKETTADYFLHNYAETLQAYTYTACTSSTSPNYVSLAKLAAPSGFSAPVQTSIKYWNSTSFVAACQATDLGLQQITLNLASADGRASESITVVVRKP